MRLRPAWPITLILLIASCRQAPTPPGKMLVVASFYPLYEFSRQVAGDRAEVVSLVPPGVEPHDWEPSPQDLARIEKARLFVYNGAGLEPWADRFLNGLTIRKVVIVRAAEGIPLITGDTGKKEHTAPDPHVWLDPVLARSMVEAIRAGFGKADPDHTATYEANARAYAERLAALHEAFQAGLSRCARRDIVVSHAAFAYLARRYGLTQVPAFSLRASSAPSWPRPWHGRSAPGRWS